MLALHETDQSSHREYLSDLVAGVYAPLESQGPADTDIHQTEATATQEPDSYSTAAGPSTTSSLASATSAHPRQEPTRSTTSHRRKSGLKTGQPTVAQRAGPSEESTSQQPVGPSPSAIQPPAVVPDPPHTISAQYQQQFAGSSSSGPQDIDMAHGNPGADSMFGLEPLGYSEAISWFSSPTTANDVGMQPVFATEGGGHQGHGSPDSLSDFAVLNDTLSVWTNGPVPLG